MDPQLRTIFLEELEDLLEALAQALSVLATAPRADARDRATLQIRRALHTLKGAAHVVGEETLQVACEEAESAIAQQPDGPTVEATAREVLPRLQARLEALRRQYGPPREVERAVEHAAEPAPAERRTEPPVGRVEPRDAAPAQAPDAQAPEAQAPETLAPEAEAPEAQAVVSAPLGDPSREGATLRVRADRVDAILHAADELMAALVETRIGDVLERADRGLEAARRALEAVVREAELGRAERRWQERSQAVLALHAVRDAGTQASEALHRERMATELVRRSSGRLARELRALRMGRFDTLAPVLEAAVTEIAATLGRRARLHLDGASTEVDRQLRDELRDPLLHLLRNAVDHGIEPPEERAERGKPLEGRVEVRASIVGGELHISVADDGRGLDLDAVAERARALGLTDDQRRVDPLSLLFEAGLSTRSEASSISGRGIGLDVVRDRIARMHGRVQTESQPGLGTRFLLRLPLSRGALQVLHAHCRGVSVALPATAVDRVVRLPASAMITIEGRLYAPDESGPIPLARLDAALELGGGLAATESSLVWVVVRAAGRRIALGVDTVHDMNEVVVHALSGRLRRIAGVSATALLPEGEVALLLDVDAVVRMASPAVATPQTLTERPSRLLVVDDSVTTRALQRTLLEVAGYEVVTAANGREALERLRTIDVDAVITDVEMPELDGFELLGRIRALPRTRNLPVVLVTARDRESDRRRALDLDASAYVLKREFDRDRLLALLEDLL